MSAEMEERLERAEQTCRDLRRSVLMLSTGVLAAAIVAVFAAGLAPAVALAVAAAAVVAVVETRPSKDVEVVRARKLEIIGANGSVRVSIGETVEGAGTVAAYDATGRFIAALAAVSSRESLGHAARAPRASSDERQ
jgi:hypothetical protein